MTFQPGQSGNPGGKNKNNRAAQLCREKTEKAVQVLIDTLENVEESSETRMKAAIALLDRGWGKPHQAIALGGDPENDTPVALQIIRPK